ncbi:MAG: response regulator transcription factor [Parabacteroides sp.]|nr:response regulator transcription factor [Parabacteroides sp.]
MRMNLKIAIAEPAELMRIGLGTILKRFSGFQIQLVELAQGSAWKDSLRLHHPDILIVNPIIPGYQDLQQIKEETGCETMKCIALVAAPIEATQLQHYDEQIHVYDSSQTIRHKLESLFHEEEDEEDKENEDENQLSSREKEIVICVVKGMTNREIADLLFLSTHTVVTHRRNITRKLQIHSPSGLTVYAIVNKLVTLNDIQQGSGEGKE